MLIQPEPQGLWEFTPRLNHTLKHTQSRVKHTMSSSSSGEGPGFFFFSSTHLIVFRDHPDHANPDRHVERFHLGSWRLDLDPRCAWK